MGTLPINSLGQHNIRFLSCFIILFLSCITARINLCSNLPFTPNTSEPNLFNSLFTLKTLKLDGHISFDDLHRAAKDFGNRFQHYPSAILHPKSVSDIATTIKHIFQMGPISELTLAARGHGHSLQGQAQTLRGVVVNMESLKKPEMQVCKGKIPYVDVSGGELWINILHETLKHGLAPKSWTDYLHLTVGGTLSNAGVSGQAFRHGPQISNVHEVEVVTGKGEVLNCSEKHNADLFYGVLGGLGQFGIITRARIALEPAPTKVKWIRVLYSDFSIFARDQEYLISSKKTFDYIEGLVIINRTGLVNNWRASFTPQYPLQASKFNSEGKTLYCLEMTKNLNSEDAGTINQEVETLLSHLSYIPSTLFVSEVSYLEFLDRVHQSEIKLQSKGLWDVPHPWLNLLIPRTKIHDFTKEVFGNILTDTSNGPVLIYPLKKHKWNNRTSAVLPEEDVFYLVAFLASAVPSSTGKSDLEHILTQQKRILDFCKTSHIGMKQYLPHYTTQEEWKAHFSSQWKTFVQRKSAFDPLAILAPGHRIFQKGMPLSQQWSSSSK